MQWMRANKQWCRWGSWALLLCASHAMAADSTTSTKDEARPLYGEWRLVGASGPVPIECRRMSLQIDPAGMLVERAYSPQGQLFSLQARTHISRKGSVYVLALSQIRHNGEPDCQGQSASQVVKNLPSHLELELSGDRLFHYLAGRDGGAFLRYERVATPGMTAATSPIPGAID